MIFFCQNSGGGGELLLEGGKSQGTPPLCETLLKRSRMTLMSAS